jgi:hypothetical protein
VRYLSPEWFTAANEALAADDKLRQLTADLGLVLEQTVEGGPDGPICWHFVLDHGEVQLVAGPTWDADIRFRTNYEVAEAIAQGDLAAPQAFVDGDLSVTGDLRLLVTQLHTLAALDDALAEVRRATTFA